MAREFARSIITENLRPILEAQISHAKGIKYLVIRHKLTGKFLRVGEQAAKNHDPATEVVEVWEKDPSSQAFVELMNRALDATPKAIEVSGAGGGPLVVKWAE